MVQVKRDMKRLVLGRVFVVAAAFVALLTDPSQARAQSEPATATSQPAASQSQPAPVPSTAADEIEEVADIEEVGSPTRYRSRQYPVTERVINMMTARTTRKYALLFVIDHRNQQSIADNPFHDYFGFDGGGLKIGIGLRFGILDNLDVGILRLNNTVEVFDTYEFDVKYAPLNQVDHYLDLAVRAGVTWFSQEDAEDAAGGFGQLLISRTFWDLLLVGTGLLFHSESSTDVKSSADEAWSLAVQAVLEVRPLSWLAWDFELSANVAGYCAAHPIFSTAIQFITNRHTFAVVVTNSQYIGADGIVANSDRALDEVILGFSITRELQF